MVSVSVNARSEGQIFHTKQFMRVEKADEHGKSTVEMSVWLGAAGAMFGLT